MQDFTDGRQKTRRRRRAELGGRRAASPRSSEPIFRLLIVIATIVLITVPSLEFPAEGGQLKSYASSRNAIAAATNSLDENEPANNEKPFGE